MINFKFRKVFTMTNQTLIIFSASYQIDKYEPFLANELKIITKWFDKIIVICPATDSDWYWYIPDKVKVIPLSDYKHENISYLELFKIFFVDVLDAKFRFVNTWRENSAHLKDKIKQSNALKEFLLNNKLERAIYYTYWFDDWAIVLSLLKKRGVINSFISRAHGFDLFEFRRKTGRIPYRWLQLSEVDRVFSVSEMGKFYLQERHPEYSFKYKVSRLGTRDYGICKYISDNVHIVSCSGLIDLKRVQLILETVSLFQKVSWTHFGEGPLYEDLKMKADQITSKSPSIKINFRGFVSNNELMMFYLENPVSVFVNVSTTEGLPVSLMEASSFGIPMVATNVGGTREIVTNQTGVLLSINPSTEDIFYAIQIVLRRFNTISERMKVREYWKKNFYAISNYNSFVKDLISS